MGRPTAVRAAWLSRPAVAVMVASLVCALVPPAAHAATPRHTAGRPSVLAEVRFIHLGLTVQPPKSPPQAGRVQQALYQEYALRTDKQQRASIGFVDRSVLHLNQLTDAVLRSPSLTYVDHGEVSQVLEPGTQHRVQTATALAAATGTSFDVRAADHQSLFLVVEGSLLVSNPMGSVVVKTNEATLVVAGKAPGAPFAIDAKGAIGWTAGLSAPDPPLETNIALDANGGHVIAVSSQSSSGPGTGQSDARFLIDGRFDTGWATGAGQVANQWVKIGFQQDKMYFISRVIIVTPASDGHRPSSGLRDFQIRVSTTGTDDASFVTVLRGTCHERTGPQRFSLSRPVRAKYVELYVMDNYGDPTGTDVAEFEVAGGSVSAPSTSACPIAHACIGAVLGMLNRVRAQSRLTPFRLSEAQTIGTPSCVGAYGHSVAMARTGQLWHTNPKDLKASYPADICVPHQTSAEDVGEGASGNELTDLSQVTHLWLADSHNRSTCKITPTHACNILNPSLTSVGIGIYFTRGTTWVTLDFIGSLASG